LCVLVQELTHKIVAGEEVHESCRLDLNNTVEQWQADLKLWGSEVLTQPANINGRHVQIPDLLQVLVQEVLQQHLIDGRTATRPGDRPDVVDESADHPVWRLD
jgi:hypothetical protein